MTRRLVTSTTRDARGYVSHLCNPGEPWSPRSTVDAVLDIELGEFSYFVREGDRHTEVLSLHDAGGTYLGAHPDDSGRNALLDLPVAR